MIKLFILFISCYLGCAMNMTNMSPGDLENMSPEDLQNLYPEPPAVSGCPTSEQSRHPENRLELVKCERDTLFRYIGEHKCCEVSHLGCDILISAYLLVYPEAPYVCPKSS